MKTKRLLHIGNGSPIVFFRTTFLRGFAQGGYNRLSLKQRFFHVGWSVWFVYLSLAFSRALEDRRIKS
jgi:hypothetical protein